jgi:sugar lactone lactonase YvrE
MQLLIDRSGNLLIADRSARRVRRVASDGSITTIAGGGTTKLSDSSGKYAPDGTKATDLELADASGIAVDGKGRVYVSDAGVGGVIFRFGSDGAMELVIADQVGAGGAQTPGQPANATRVTNPGELAVDTQGNLLYLDALVLWRIAGAGS